MSALYKAYNGPFPTTAAQQKVTTGTAIKTLLQISTKTGIDLKIKEWGISFDGSAAATPGTVELVETDVAATVTAYASADVVKMTNPGGPAADSGLITLGTANSGYTASAEGSITATREMDVQQIAPTNQYVYQAVLGNEGLLQAGKFLRIRVTYGAAINAICYVMFEG